MMRRGRALASRGVMTACIVSVSRIAPFSAVRDDDFFFTLIANSTGNVCVVHAWDNRLSPQSMEMRTMESVIGDLHTAAGRPAPSESPRGVRGGHPRVLGLLAAPGGRAVGRSMAAEAMRRLFGRHIGDGAMQSDGYKRVTSVEFGAVRGTFRTVFGDMSYNIGRAYSVRPRGSVFPTPEQFGIP